MDEDLLENSNKLLAVIPAVKPKGKPSAATTYTIGGVKVDFPVKAYPSQISMMNQVGGRLFQLHSMHYHHLVSLCWCTILYREQFHVGTYMNFISTFSVLAENKLEEYVKIIFCDCDIHYTQAHIIYSQGVYLSFKSPPFKKKFIKSHPSYSYK